MKSTVMMVRPQLLFLPGNFQGSSSPDPTTKFQLLDRVVNIREGYTVPLGLRGTVIAIQNGKYHCGFYWFGLYFVFLTVPSFSADKEADVIYEVVFDKEFCGGLRLRLVNRTTV